MKAILGSRRHDYVKRLSIFLTTAALIAGMMGCEVPSRDLEIRDWYDLDAVRRNLSGNHRLLNDLDATTDGYEELASPTANGGKGWKPSGTGEYPFTGSFDGQGYEVRDLFINRPDETGVALFGAAPEGVVKNVGAVNVFVTGRLSVGALAGGCGNVSDCYSSGNVTGEAVVGGLLGSGRVSNSYSSANVTGMSEVGGLVGAASGLLSSCYSTGSVNGELSVGGLLGRSLGSTVRDSYSSANVTGMSEVGGLVGTNAYASIVSNCYSSGSVGGESDVGGLVGRNGGTVRDSFWDTETSGTEESDGGTGKTTTDMKDIATFTDMETEGLEEAWDITAVAAGETSQDYIWNIVDGVTYPFLSW